MHAETQLSAIEFSNRTFALALRRGNTANLGEATIGVSLTIGLFMKAAQRDAINAPGDRALRSVATAHSRGRPRPATGSRWLIAYAP